MCENIIKLQSKTYNNLFRYTHDIEKCFLFLEISEANILSKFQVSFINQSSFAVSSFQKRLPVTFKICLILECRLLFLG